MSMAVFLSFLAKVLADIAIYNRLKSGYLLRKYIILAEKWTLVQKNTII